MGRKLESESGQSFRPRRYPSPSSSESSIDEQESFNIFSVLCGHRSSQVVSKTESKFPILFPSNLNIGLKNTPPPRVSLGWFYGPPSDVCISSEKNTSEANNIFQGAHRVHRPPLADGSKCNSRKARSQIQRSDSLLSWLCGDYRRPERRNVETSESSNESFTPAGLHSMIEKLCCPPSRNHIPEVAETSYESSTSNESIVNNYQKSSSRVLSGIFISRSVLHLPTKQKRRSESKKEIENSSLLPRLNRVSSKGVVVAMNAQIDDRRHQYISRQMTVSRHHSRQSDGESSQQSQRSDISIQTSSGSSSGNFPKSSWKLRTPKRRNFIAVLKGFPNVNEQKTSGDSTSLSSSYYLVTNGSTTTSSSISTEDIYTKVVSPFYDLWMSFVNYARSVLCQM